MKRKRMSALGMLSVFFAAVVLAVMGASPATAAASGDGTAAAASPVGALTWYTYKDCPEKYFCVYDSYGHMCKWKGDADNWYTACSWAGTNYPKYAYNHGRETKWGVTIYRYTDQQSPIGGCVIRDEKVTLAGNYYIGSHSWNCKE